MVSDYRATDYFILQHKTILESVRWPVTQKSDKSSQTLIGPITWSPNFTIQVVKSVWISDC